MKFVQIGVIDIKEEKSAKDIAFEKERAKFRRQVRELERENKELARNIRELNGMLQDQEAKIAGLQDWIERLFEYTELSKDEMRKIIQKDKSDANIAERLKDMEKLFLRFSMFGGMH